MNTFTSTLTPTAAARIVTRGTDPFVDTHPAARSAAYGAHYAARAADALTRGSVHGGATFTDGAGAAVDATRYHAASATPHAAADATVPLTRSVRLTAAAADALRAASAFTLYAATVSDHTPHARAVRAAYRAAAALATVTAATLRDGTPHADHVTRAERATAALADALRTAAAHAPLT